MIKSGDFVQLDYTGTLEDGTVFDTTQQAVAQANRLAARKSYAPVVACVGERMVLSGIDDALVGKSPGTFTITLEPEHAFGKKDPKRVRIIPTEQLRRQNIRPMPGMQLAIDNEFGTVLRTGGGRTMVDFNHPLASQRVVYTVTVHNVVTDVAAQIKALLEPIGLGLSGVEVKGTNVTLVLPALPPKPYMDAIQHKITQRTAVKTVSFEAGKKSI